MFEGDFLVPGDLAGLLVKAAVFCPHRGDFVIGLCKRSH